MYIPLGMVGLKYAVQGLYGLVSGKGRKNIVVLQAWSEMYVGIISETTCNLTIVSYLVQFWGSENSLQTIDDTTCGHYVSPHPGRNDGKGGRGTKNLHMRRGRSTRVEERDCSA